MMLNCHVVGIHEIFEVEEFLSLFNAALCQSCGLGLFVNNIIAVVVNQVFNILF